MRVRFEFTEHGKVRFISHRDVGRMFERALRKLRLPVAYSEGFSPRPKLSFGLALSVGHESEAEYLDINFTTAVDLQDLPERLTAALPEGIAVTRVVSLPPGTPSLQEAVTSCTWQIEVTGPGEQAVVSTMSALLAADSLPLERERKGKRSTVDVRPAILHVEVLGPTENGMALCAELGTDTVSLRPNEFVGLFGADAVEGRITRLAQWTTTPERTTTPKDTIRTNTEGTRQSPLEAPVGHAEVRAS